MVLTQEDDRPHRDNVNKQLGNSELQNYILSLLEDFSYVVIDFEKITDLLNQMSHSTSFQRDRRDDDPGSSAMGMTH